MSNKYLHFDEIVDDSNDNISSVRVLINLNRSLCEKLNQIEKKLENVNQRLTFLEGNLIIPLNNQSDTSLQSTYSSQFAYQNNTPIKTVNQLNEVSSMIIPQDQEVDYPNGSWLGDINNPEMSVRASIHPSDLAQLNTSCKTAEKMALALLDHLFDRNTQASSNLSGMSKHGKKKLNPLLIFGIKCHLIHYFNINEEDWRRIRINMDSKCRTAYRRKIMGRSLNVKAFRTKFQDLTSAALQLQNQEEEVVFEEESQNILITKQENECIIKESDIGQFPEHLSIDNTLQSDSSQFPIQLDQLTSLTMTNEQFLELQKNHKVIILLEPFNQKNTLENNENTCLSISEEMQLIKNETIDFLEIISPNQ